MTDAVWGDNNALKQMAKLLGVGKARHADFPSVQKSSYRDISRSRQSLIG